MRDSKYSLSILESQIRNNLVEEDFERVLTLRNHVIDSPNFLSENYLVLPFKLRNLIGLSILSWFIPDEIGFILREDIREKRLTRLSLGDQFLMELILLDKWSMLSFLNETNLWTNRDFYGNILYEGKRSLRSLRFRRINHKVIPKIRKRGYDDHGSRVEDHRKLPKHDYSLIELQNLIEEQRKSKEDTLNFTKGFLE